MNTNELLAGLRSRAASLKAELAGIQAAIQALTGDVAGGPGGQEFTCSVCGQRFLAKRKAWICRKVSCRTERKRQTVHAQLTGQQPTVPVRKIRPRGTMLVRGAQK